LPCTVDLTILAIIVARLEVAQLCRETLQAAVELVLPYLISWMKANNSIAESYGSQALFALRGSQT